MTKTSFPINTTKVLPNDPIKSNGYCCFHSDIVMSEKARQRYLRELNNTVKVNYKAEDIWGGICRFMTILCLIYRKIQQKVEKIIGVRFNGIRY